MSQPGPDVDLIAVDAEGSPEGASPRGGLRIAVLGPAFPFRGGIAHHTSLLANYLAQRHALILLTFRRQYPSWLYPGRTDKDPSDEGIGLPAERVLSPFDPLSWWRAARRVKEHGCELLIVPWWVSFWAPSVRFLLAFLGRQRPKVLFICHNVLPHEGRSGLHAILTRMALRQGDQFIVHSKSDEAKLRNLLGSRTLQPIVETSQVFVEHAGGVDGLEDLDHHDHHDDSELKVHRARLPLHEIAEQRDRREARGRLGIREDAKVVLFFGFVRSYKGLDVLIRALPRLRQIQPSATLVVAGEFWEPLAEYEELADSLDVLPHVAFHDRYIANEEVGDFFAAADVLAMPYRSATQSGVITLAVQAGLPIVATRVGGLPEAVTHDRTGLIVEPEAPEELAEALGRILSDEALYLRFQAGLREARAEFGWPKLIQLIEEIAADMGLRPSPEADSV